MPNDFAAPGVRRAIGAAPKPPVRVYGDGDEIELRAGVEPASMLLAERQVLIDKVAHLRAEFGPFGTWDHRRKSELSRIKSLIRLQAMQDKRKMNNDQVDEEAHEHPDYVTFVANATRDRAEYFKLEAKIEAVDYRLNRGQALLRYVASEPRT